jgi:heme exporter protein D
MILVEQSMGSFEFFLWAACAVVAIILLAWPA